MRAAPGAKHRGPNVSQLKSAYMSQMLVRAVVTWTWEKDLTFSKGFDSMRRINPCPRLWLDSRRAEIKSANNLTGYPSFTPATPNSGHQELVEGDLVLAYTPLSTSDNPRSGSRSSLLRGRNFPQQFSRHVMPPVSRTQSEPKASRSESLRGSHHED